MQASKAWSNFTSQCRRDYSRHQYFMDSNNHGIEGSFAESVTVAWDDDVNETLHKAS